MSDYPAGGHVKSATLLDGEGDWEIQPISDGHGSKVRLNFDEGVEPATLQEGGELVAEERADVVVRAIEKCRGGRFVC